MSDTPTPEVIEAAARAINEQHEFPAPLWSALVESKDRADRHRVKRDRAYATAALTAAYPLMVASVKAEVLAEVANDYMGEFPFMREQWLGDTDPASEAAREIGAKTLAWLRSRARAATIENEAS